MPGLQAARQIVVTPPGHAVARQLTEALLAAGLPASTGATIPAGTDAVIALHALQSDAGPQQSLACHAQVFAAARALATSIEPSEPRLFVTVHDSGGDFGQSCAPARAWLAGVPGIAKSAQHEWPGSVIKCIDLECDSRHASALASAIARELLAGGDTQEVGLKSDGRRIELVTGDAGVTAPATGKLDSHSVLVVTGGARGVTGACVEALARACQPKLLLLGRTPLEDEPACCANLHDDAAIKQALLAQSRRDGESLTPAALSTRSAGVLAAREVRATLERIEHAGSRVRYASVDVCDTPAVAAAIDAARKAFGPVTGLVHAAGVLADKRIADKTPAQFERVFGTKVAGLAALLAATIDDPLTLCAVFGSVAGRYGNVGQCDYAAANEVLNRVALAESAHGSSRTSSRTAQPCQFKALNWGPWDGGMVTPALRAHFASQGIALIEQAAGAAQFVAELREASPGDVEVLLSANSAHD